MFKKWVIALLLIPILTFSQEDQNTLLANQFFQNKAYDKAIPIYKSILKKDYDKYIYQNLLTAYLKTKAYDPAIKMVKKASKLSNEPYIQLIDLGHLYGLTENISKQDQQYNTVIKSILPKEYVVNSIAKRFEYYQLSNEAIKAYERGQNELADKSIFNKEIAANHLKLNNYKKAFSYYLNHLSYYPNNVEDIEGIFNQICTDKEKKTILKELLFRAVQRQPENGVMVQLLIWNLNTVGEFNESFLQAKAYDRKSNSGGKVVLDLSKTFRELKAYQPALTALDYLINNGNNFFAFMARKDVLAIKKEAIENNFPVEISQVKILIDDYKSFIASHGINIKTINIAKDMAYMYAFYLEEYDSAIIIINTILKQSNIDRKTRGEIKILLGDIQLLSGDKWESQLTYWQIDKDFKESVIGHQAKYKVAMLSYYTGDFEWAQNQLEALKGSTTKLISNDAISLSTFITENYGIDSNDVPLKLFASAQLLLYQKQYEKANLKFDTISNIYSDHILMDDILFKKAQIAQQKNDSSSAIKYYKTIIEKYNEDLLLDDAIFHLAELYHSINNDSKIALQYYQDILINHPDSIYVTEARKKYRRLRGDNLN